MIMILNKYLEHSFSTSRKQDKGYCFLAQAQGKEPASVLDVSDFHTLNKVMAIYNIPACKFVFWTPNTFYTYKRNKESLR